MTMKYLENNGSYSVMPSIRKIYQRCPSSIDEIVSLHPLTPRRVYQIAEKFERRTNVLEWTKPEGQPPQYTGFFGLLQGVARRLLGKS